MQSDGTGTNRLTPFVEVAMWPNGTLRPKVGTAVCPHPEEADMGAGQARFRVRSLVEA